MTNRSASPSVKITLVGLNRLTASLGLALRERGDIHLIGFDRDNDVARIAQSRRLVHKAEWNLLGAVDGADLVLISGPLADQREWLKAMAGDLRTDAVVACLAPLLGAPLTWAADLPEKRHFIAAHPILNPAYLYDGSLGIDGAQADLFTKGLWALAPAETCAPEALKLLSDLATAVGAAPYFVDPLEHDGLMGGVEALPAVVSAALFLAANDSSGWSDLRKVADRGFATATFPLAELDPAVLLHNRENALRYLDSALENLQALRASLAREDRLALEAALSDARQRRAKWLAERERGEWEAESRPRAEVPSLSETMGRFFTGGFFTKKKEN
jgi:prephenate dehydrogenase